MVSHRPSFFHVLFLVLSLANTAFATDAQGSRAGAARVAPAPEAAPFAFVHENQKIDPALRDLVRDRPPAGATARSPRSVRPDISVEITDEGDVLIPCLIRSTDPAETERRVAELGGVHRVTAGDVVVAVVRSTVLEALAVGGDVVSVSASYIRESLLNVSRPSTGADQVFAGTGLPASYTGKNVIVGVVDSGIDYLHPDFWTAVGPRILAIWDVSGVAAGGQPRICSYSQIAAGTCSQVDLNGHGTHVAGTAAGNGRALAGYHGMAPEADLIVAKGVRSTTASGGFSDADVITACDYIFQEARRLGRPAVINLSLGGNGGPLDGTSNWERALSNLVGPGRTIIAANGNSGGDRIHLSYTTSGSNYSQSLETIWAISDPTGATVDLWYPTGAIYVGVAYRLSASDVNPIAYTPAAGPGQSTAGFWELRDPTTGILLAVYNLDAATTSDPNNGARHVKVTVVPAFPGVGVFSLYTYGSGTFDAWALSSSRFGSQSGGFWRPGDFAMTVGTPASAQKVIAVGAHTTKTQWTDIDGVTRTAPASAPLGEIAPFSSLGPTRDGRSKPQISAPGNVVVAPLSYNASTTRDRVIPGAYYQVMEGTSMASPHVAGGVALMLQADPALDYGAVLSALQATAVKDSFTGVNPDPNKWGAGKLNVYAAVQSVANAASSRRPLTVTKGGTGQGTVTSTPAGVACGENCIASFAVGSNVVLTATPAPGVVFGGWSGAGCAGTGTCTVAMSEARTVSATFVPTQSSRYYPVTPCRVVDTRNAPGALGGPALTAGTARSFTLAGYCGVPVDAKAVSMNATVSQATSQGSLTLYPGGGDGPGTSAISFPVGRDRANNAILGLTGGVLSVRDNQTTGTVHFIVDVNGYFR